MDKITPFIPSESAKDPDSYGDQPSDTPRAGEALPDTPDGDSEGLSEGDPKAA